MKKSLLILAVVFTLAACETTPPQWWDPSGKYMTPEQTAPAAKQESKGVAVRLGGPPEPQQPIDDNAIIFEPVEREKVEVADLPPPSVLEE